MRSTLPSTNGQESAAGHTAPVAQPDGATPPKRDRLAMSAPLDHAAQLGAFLRSRRERLTPNDVGLPTIGQRRTAGLRREEVAQLAGISAVWGGSSTARVHWLGCHAARRRSGPPVGTRV